MRPEIVGIIGNKGKYGIWLTKFFDQLNYKVIGSDIKTEITNKDVVEQADAVIFSIPIDVTVEVIEGLVECARPEQIWMDITSIKQAPIEAMLKSSAAVAGLHPMCAPTVASWKAQTVVLCPIPIKSVD